VGAANRRRGGFREAEVLHLALLDQILDSSGDIFNGHIRIDAVLVVEIDRLDSQSRERSLDHTPDVFGATVEMTPPRLAVGARCPPEFRRDHDLAAERRQRLADQLLVRVRSVDFCRIEERHAAFDRGVEQRHHGVSVRNRAVGPTHAHASQANRRDLETALPKFPCLHVHASREIALSVAFPGHSPVLVGTGRPDDQLTPGELVPTRQIRAHQTAHQRAFDVERPGLRRHCRDAGT
jgi:hypothetical protein